MKANPSNEPVVEKAQHEPQSPWFLTGVTAPFCLQSTVAGKASRSNKNSSDGVSALATQDSTSAGIVKQEIYSLNSSVVKSANWFNPTVEVLNGSALKLRVKM
jgi:hypothetical protein